MLCEGKINQAYIETERGLLYFETKQTLWAQLDIWSQRQHRFVTWRPPLQR